MGHKTRLKGLGSDGPDVGPIGQRLYTAFWPLKWLQVAAMREIAVQAVVCGGAELQTGVVQVVVSKGEC